jgi:hypothetical protein
MEELKSLVEKQIDYLARYEDIMTDIDYVLTEMLNYRLHDDLTVLPIIKAQIDQTIVVDKQIDAPRWFNFYFYECREPVLKNVRFSPTIVVLTIVCGDREYYIYLRVGGVINLHDVITLAGLPLEVWEKMLSIAKEIHPEVYKNLETLHNIAKVIGENAFSTVPKSVSPVATLFRTSSLRINKYEISKLVEAYKIVASTDCGCIYGYKLQTLADYFSQLEIRVLPEDTDESLGSTLQLNKPVEVPEWLVNARRGRKYVLLRSVSIEGANIILLIEYERDGKREIEEVYLLDDGELSLGNLVLASYILDDEVWEWILKEVTEYLMLVREANIMIKDYVVPMVKLTI